MTISNSVLNLNVRQLLFKRQTTPVAEVYVGPSGEVVFDTGLKGLRVHDGVTVGGTRVPTLQDANIAGNVWSSHWSNIYVNQALIPVYSSIANAVAYSNSIQGDVQNITGNLAPALAKLESVWNSLGNNVNFLGYVNSEFGNVNTRITNEINRAVSVEGSLAVTIATESNARVAALGSIGTQIANVVAALNSEISARSSADATHTLAITNLNTDLNSETTLRATGDTLLGTAITVEANARIAADSQEANSRISADAAISANLATEITDRIAAVSNQANIRLAEDISLQANIIAEQTARNAAIAAIQANISAEVLRATTRESSIDSNIAAESNARSVAINTVTTNLNNEVTRATAREAAIDANVAAESIARNLAITSEANARIAADLSLQSNIAAESAARAATKTLIDTNIAALASTVNSLHSLVSANVVTANARAVAAEAVLQANITAEQTARLAAVATLTNSISTETNNRIAAVTTLTNSISIESVNRQANAAALQSQINNILNNTSPGALDSLAELVLAFQAADANLLITINTLTSGVNSTIGLETSRAVAAEATLQANINNERTSRISDINSTLAALASANAAQTSATVNEAALRTAADVALQTNINTETTNRGIAVTALYGNIHTEIAARIAGDNAEITARSAADSALSANIAALQAVKHQLSSGAVSADLASTGILSVPGHLIPKNNLNQDLGSPTQSWRNLYVAASTIYLGTSSVSVDPVAGLQVSTGGSPAPLSGNVKFSDGSMQTTAFLPSFITTETTARTNAVNSLQANINTVDAARISGNAVVSARIAQEITDRTAADNSLQSNINTVDAARISGNAVVSARIAQEITDRIAAANSLQSNINTVDAARITSNAVIASLLNAEITSRVAGDTALQANILALTNATTTANTVVSTRVDNEITARIAGVAAAEANVVTERTRALAAEAAIAANVSTLSVQVATGLKPSLLNGTYYANLTVGGELTVPGNILPTGNTFSLGKSTARWNEIYISNTGLNIGNAAIRLSDSGDFKVSTGILTTGTSTSVNDAEWLSTGPTLIMKIYEDSVLFGLVKNFTGGEIIEAKSPFTRDIVIQNAPTIPSSPSGVDGSGRSFYNVEFTVDSSRPSGIVPGSGSTTYQYLLGFKFVFTSKTNVSSLINGNVSAILDTTGNLTVPSFVIPKTNGQAALGNANRKWQTIYLDTTAQFNDVRVTVNAGGIRITNVSNVSLPYFGNVVYTDGSVQTTAFLTSFITNEANTRANLIANLQSQINFINQNTDPAAIDSLTELLANFNSVSSSVSSIAAAAVQAETTRANLAEISLQANITAEVVRATAAEAVLRGNITTESQTRANAVANLQSQINSILSNTDASALDSLSEVVAFINSSNVASFNTLANGINSEAGIRLAADQALQANITAESQTRSNAVTAINANITTLFNNLASSTTANLVNGSFVARLNSTGNLVVPGHIVPSTTLTHDLGTPTQQWRSLYVSANTIYLGNTGFSVSQTGTISVIGGVEYGEFTGVPATCDWTGNVVTLANFSLNANGAALKDILSKLTGDEQLIITAPFSRTLTITSKPVYQSAPYADSYVFTVNESRPAGAVTYQGTGYTYQFFMLFRIAIQPKANVSYITNFGKTLSVSDTGNVVVPTGGGIVYNDGTVQTTAFTVNYITTLNSNIANLQTQLNTVNSTLQGVDTTLLANVSTLFSNAASQQTTIDSLLSNAITQQTTINSLLSNAITQQTTIDSLSSSATSLLANAVTQQTSLDSLVANAVSQQTTINSLLSNAITQQTTIDSLSGTATSLLSNAVTQQTSLNSLLANAVTQQTSLDSLLANAATQQTTINTMVANAITQQTTIDSLLANAVIQQTSIDNLSANAISQQTTIDSLSANAITQQTTIDSLLANAVIQQTSIDNLSANAISQQTTIDTMVANAITQQTTINTLVDRYESAFDIKTASFTAVSNRRYGINTGSGAITATLPASPAAGDAVFFADAGGNYAVNPLTVSAGSNSITNVSNSSSGTLAVSTNGDSFGVFWTGSTWRLYE